MKGGRQPNRGGTIMLIVRLLLGFNQSRQRG